MQKVEVGHLLTSSVKTLVTGWQRFQQDSIHRQDIVASLLCTGEGRAMCIHCLCFTLVSALESLSHCRCGKPALLQNKAHLV